MSSGGPWRDYLQGGVHELRFKSEGINYRVLYFFQERTAVVVSHGFIKQEAAVPAREMRRALARKVEFDGDPVGHTFHPDE